MNPHEFDWLIIVSMLLLVGAGAFWAKRKIDKAELKRDHELRRKRLGHRPNDDGAGGTKPN